MELWHRLLVGLLPESVKVWLVKRSMPDVVKELNRRWEAEGQPQRAYLVDDPDQGVAIAIEEEPIVLGEPNP